MSPRLNSFKPHDPEFALARPLEGPNKWPNPRFTPLSAALDKTSIIDAEAVAFRQSTGGSKSEYKVYHWLENKGYIAGVDFAFQSDRRGGISHIGNAKIQFIVYASKLVLRVQGYLWPNLNKKAHALDEIQRVIWEAKGYIVLDLLASEIDEDVNHVMTLAINQNRMTAAAAAVLR